MSRPVRGWKWGRLLHEIRFTRPRVGVGYTGARAHFLLLGGLVTLLLLAAGPAPAQVTVNVESHDGSYNVHGSFFAGVKPSIAWSVLSDYDHLSDFVSSLKTSEVVQRDADGRILLHQVASAGPFPFRRTLDVVLEVRENVYHSIAFHDTSDGEDSEYKGEWTLVPDSAGARVDYRLHARPHSVVPGFVMRLIMDHSVDNLMSQVREEMIRRGCCATCGCMEGMIWRR